MLLANASHELRTPLSRIRLGLELFEAKPDPKIKADIARDISELDDLIEEILLASRLDIAAAPPAAEDVDLLALVAEECAHYDGCALDGELVVVRGDARLLRRLVRNLLDNAKRHGRPPIRVELRREGRQVSLSVVDAGDGIPSSEREHVFLPFYRFGGDRKGVGLGARSPGCTAATRWRRNALMPGAASLSGYRFRRRAGSRHLGMAVKANPPFAGRSDTAPPKFALAMAGRK